MTTANPFLPDLNVLPQHDTPSLRGVDLTADKIQVTVASMHSLEASAALGVAESYPVELTVNGRACVLTADVHDGWYLAETSDHHESPRAKEFYLLPVSQREFEKHGGAVPSVRCEDVDFDYTYQGATESRTVRWYVMGLLIRLIKR